VFLAWQLATGKQRTKLDLKRKRLIAAALKLYELDDVCDAVRGWRHDAFYRGENDRGKAYTELSVLLRDADHIEYFRDLERGLIAKNGPPIAEDRATRLARKSWEHGKQLEAMGL
jgi:hypothetical protein